MHDEPATDLSPPARIRALEANVSAFGRRYGRAPNAEVSHFGGMTLFITRVADPFFNGVIEAALDERNADARIEEVFAFFRNRRLPFMWGTGPSSRPADLDARLEQRNPFLSIKLPGMVLDLSALTGGGPLPAGFRIEEVSTRSQLEQWVTLGCKVFEMPDAIVPAVIELEDQLGMGDDKLVSRLSVAWSRVWCSDGMERGA